VAARAEAEARREGLTRLQWNALRLDGSTLPVEMTLAPLRLAEQHDALPEFGEHSMAAGLDDYLTKPVDGDALERVPCHRGRAGA
jgi:hypothetical protein